MRDRACPVEFTACPIVQFDRPRARCKDAAVMLLEKLLAGLSVRVEPFAVCEVRGDAHLVFGPRDDATVHYALAGVGRVCILGGATVAVAPHSFLVVPPRVRQRIEPAFGASRPALPAQLCRPLDTGLEWHAAGRGEPGLLMACGAVRATYRETRGLFDYLEAPLAETFRGDARIRTSFEGLLAELAAPQPGSAALTEAMMRQCLVLLLRRHCERGECRVPWLAALEDARLGAAVAAMLDSPEAPFTVERLAELAGMSRSAFSQHFAQTFGRAPIDFLKELRLRRAAETLRNTDLPVKAVARSVGYASRSYFSRAFKAFYGVDPARFRSRDGGGAAPAEPLAAAGPAI